MGLRSILEIPRKTDHVLVDHGLQPQDFEWRNGIIINQKIIISFIKSLLIIIQENNTYIPDI